MKKIGFVIAFFLFFLWGCNQQKLVIAFNSNGGSFIEPEIVEYGDKIAPLTPTKEGYHFAGWFYDENYLNPYQNEDIVESITLYAKWSPKQYKISFNYAIDPIIANYNSSIELPQLESKNGLIFSGWFLDPECKNKFTKSQMPLGGAYLYPKWDLEKYQVKFYSPLGLIDIQDVVYQSSVTPPDAPILQGYQFIGWDNEYDCITEDISINACYIPQQYKISFETNGGSKIDDIEVTYGNKIEKTIKPKKDLYVFDGWFLDPECLKPYQMTPITENLTLYAKWKEAFDYIIKYDGTYELYKYFGNEEIITIPSTYQNKKVTSISTNAFAYCNSLKKVVIGENIIHIRNYAFYDCKNLEEIVINNNVLLIEEGAFSLCSNLKKMTLPFIGKTKEAQGNEAHLAYIFGSEEFNNSYKISLPQNIKNYYLPKSLQEVIITNGEEVKSFSFSNCQYIKKITLPEEVNIIRKNAFYKCLQLEEINFPINLNKIESNAFYDCINLRKINVNKNLRQIGNYAFKGCINLETINFDEDSNLDTFGEGVFLGCSKIEKINIPRYITKLPKGLFAFCSELKIINYSPILTKISEYCFANCYKLRTFLSPETISIIDNYAFTNCYNLENVYLQKSLNFLGEKTFIGCEKLHEVRYEGSLIDWESKFPDFDFEIIENYDLRI